jgi:hypothetical protein
VAVEVIHLRVLPELVVLVVEKHKLLVKRLVTLVHTLLLKGMLVVVVTPQGRIRVQEVEVEQVQLV